MANSATYRHLTGMGSLTAVLLGLPNDMRAKILESAMHDLLKPIEGAAKTYARISEETGALRESITSKVKNYPANGKCVGLVGPARGYYSKGKRLKNPLAIMASGDRRQPANYAHLVEYGHIVVFPNKGTSRRKKNARETGGFVQAKPFLRPAVLTTLGAQSAAFVVGVENGFKESIERHGGGTH